MWQKIQHHIQEAGEEGPEEEQRDLGLRVGLPLFEAGTPFLGLVSQKETTEFGGSPYFKTPHPPLAFSKFERLAEHNY